MPMKEIVIDNPSSLTIHPAAAVFPPLEGRLLDDLVEDVRAHGLVEPITIHENQILDGRNRLKACELAGVPPRFQAWEGEGSRVDWIFATNLLRRHLTSSQRSLLAARKVELRAIEQRQRLGAEACLPGEQPGRARTNAARELHVGDGTVRGAQTVLRNGVPELVAKVVAGEVSVDAASRVAKLPPEKQREIVREGKEADASREIRLARLLANPPRIPPFRPVAAADAVSDAEEAGDTEALRPTTPRGVELSAFHVRLPNGTTRAEEAAKVDELVKAVNSAFCAFHWMVHDWEQRRVSDMDFVRFNANEILDHLRLAYVKLEMWSDVCHGRKRTPTAQNE